MYIICFEILTCTIWQPTDYNIIVFVLFAHESGVKKGIHIRVINILISLLIIIIVILGNQA